MTCKDCLHYEVCKHHDAVVDFPVDDGVCRFFEDRTKWVEQKHGRWRRVYDDSAGWVDMCSQCKEFGDGTNYCPNCVADMREGSVGE